MTPLGKALTEQITAGFEADVEDGSKRTVILTAIEVFSRKGLAATRISDIARAGGFSQGFVYTYFPSKDALFTHIAGLAAKGSLRAVEAAAALNASPYDRLHALTEALLSPESLAMGHWRLLLVQAAAPEGVPEAARTLIREAAPRPVRALVPVIEEGQRRGQFTHADPLMLSIAYFSMVQGLGITAVQARSAVPLPPAELILRFLEPLRGGRSKS